MSLNKYQECELAKNEQTETRCGCAEHCPSGARNGEPCARRAPALASLSSNRVLE
jgi:hypothetical protein